MLRTLLNCLFPEKTASKSEPKETEHPAQPKNEVVIPEKYIFTDDDKRLVELFRNLDNKRVVDKPLINGQEIIRAHLEPLPRSAYITEFCIIRQNPYAFMYLYINEKNVDDLVHIDVLKAAWEARQESERAYNINQQKLLLERAHTVLRHHIHTVQ